MASKYVYTLNEDTQGFSSKLNRGHLDEYYLDGDWTLIDDEMDVTFISEASSQITITLDPTELRDGFISYFIDKSGNGISFTIDGSNFNGTTNLVGPSSFSGSGDEYTLRHLKPGEFSLGL